MFTEYKDQITKFFKQSSVQKEGVNLKLLFPGLKMEGCPRCPQEKSFTACAMLNNDSMAIALQPTKRSLKQNVHRTMHITSTTEATAEGIVDYENVETDDGVKDDVVFSINGKPVTALEVLVKKASEIKEALDKEVKISGTLLIIIILGAVASSGYVTYVIKARLRRLRHQHSRHTRGLVCFETSCHVCLTRSNL